MRALAFGGVEAHLQPRRDQLHVGEFEHEVAMPGGAVELAVGHKPQPQVLLQPDHFADRGLLDRRQFGRRDFAALAAFARRDQRGRPDQAADMVGAERRLGAGRHALSSRRLRRSGTLHHFPPPPDLR
jgi:hypothetical protein